MAPPPASLPATPACASSGPVGPCWPRCSAPAAPAPPMAASSATAIRAAGATAAEPGPHWCSAGGAEGGRVAGLPHRPGELVGGGEGGIVVHLHLSGRQVDVD